MLKGRFWVTKARHRVRKAISGVREARSGVAIRALIGVESPDPFAKRTHVGAASEGRSAVSELPGDLSKVRGGL